MAKGGDKMRKGKLTLLLILISFLVIGIAGCGFLGEPELEIVNWSTQGDKGLVDTFTISGKGENVGTATGTCFIDGRIYDSSNVLLESSMGSISGIDPGEKGKFSMMFYINPDKVDHAEVEVDSCYKD